MKYALLLCKIQFDNNSGLFNAFKLLPYKFPIRVKKFSFYEHFSLFISVVNLK